MHDWCLLQQYTRDGSQAAFAELVQRHLAFVYAVCLREVRDQHLAALVLESQGYQVLKARHGDEALIVLDDFKDSVHLLLTDVKMDPYLDGCELAKCTRLLRPEIGVLYISGFTRNTMVQQEVEDGRALFLAKPFSPKELLEKVGEALMASYPSA